MALKRKWVRILSLGELPSEIRDSHRYEDKDYWIDSAKITDDRSYIGLWFDDGQSDLWKLDPKLGQWFLYKSNPGPIHTLWNKDNP